MTQTITQEWLKGATLFTITLHAWRNKKKASLAGVEVAADKDRLRLTKKLIECPEYEELVSFQNSVKGWCLDRSMPSFFRAGIFVVRLSEVEKFEAYLAEANRKIRDEYLPAFKVVYESKINEAEQALGPLFNRADYPLPSSFEARFGVEHSWVNFAVPETLPEEVRQKEIEKLNKAFSEAREEIVAALREGFQALVAHAVERLTPDENGKQKIIFGDSLIDNFNKFFDTFDARNLMNDEELAAVVKQAKDILAGVNGFSLRKRRWVRDGVREDLKEVEKLVDKLVTDKPSRRFDLEE